MTTKFTWSGPVFVTKQETTPFPGFNVLFGKHNFHFVKLQYCLTPSEQPSEKCCSGFISTVMCSESFDRNLDSRNLTSDESENAQYSTMQATDDGGEWEITSKFSAKCKISYVNLLEGFEEVPSPHLLMKIAEFDLKLLLHLRWSFLTKLAYVCVVWKGNPMFW